MQYPPSPGSQDEEPGYLILEKIIDREFEIATIEELTFRVARNLIRETDLDDKRIAVLIDVDEDYVMNARRVFDSLGKEEQNQSEPDEIDYMQLINDVRAVQEKIIYAYYEYGEDNIDVNALDEAISITTSVDVKRVKRLRLDIYPPDDDTNSNDNNKHPE